MSAYAQEWRGNRHRRTSHSERDLAALMEQQSSHDHLLRHTLSGGPAQPVRVQNDSEAICHGAGAYTGCGTQAPGLRRAGHCQPKV